MTVRIIIKVGKERFCRYCEKASEAYDSIISILEFHKESEKEKDNAFESIYNIFFSNGIKYETNRYIIEKVLR